MFETYSSMNDAIGAALAAARSRPSEHSSTMEAFDRWTMSKPGSEASELLTSMYRYQSYLTS
jgi:hypothetical protein